jgi:hypothetical protein
MRGLREEGALVDNMTIRMGDGGFYLFTDPADGLLYGFCDKACKDAWAVAEEDHAPDALSEKWGCWWCGKSMIEEGEIQWLTKST